MVLAESLLALAYYALVFLAIGMRPDLKAASARYRVLSAGQPDETVEKFARHAAEISLLLTDVSDARLTRPNPLRSPTEKTPVLES